MPHTSRNSARAPNLDREAAKAQEQEFKRARGAISCAECRRLKLKCDKSVPCGSCKRRGCESICPNGSLTTGQGTRFILADTDRLHKKIAEMSERIRQLEDALAILQSSTTCDEHPLLRVDLLSIKSGLELHAATNGRPGSENECDEDELDVPGLLALHEHGTATFYGRSAGSESLLLVARADAPAEPTKYAFNLDSLHPHLDNLANAFPAAPAALAGVADPAALQGLIVDQLPDWARARQLCELYLEQAPWFFGAITRRQLLDELLPLFYGEALNLQHLGGAQGPNDGSPQPTLPVSSSAFTCSSTGKATAHELALLFVVFCFGSLTDPGLRAAPDNAEAAQFYQLTRAAMNLEPVLDRPPSVATVQTLSLMGIYQGLVADENSIENTWSLMGLSCKLAQSVGLHRDCARWKLSPAEVQKRRALFWELFITDSWQALATGRLPSFSVPYVDTELPADPDQTLAADGTRQPSFPYWKATWGRECVSAVVEVTLLSRAPKYSLILELDRKIRDFPLPAYTRGPAPKGASLAEIMSHFMPANYLYFTLLYVHRCFFAQALQDHPKDPLRSQYAPSFLAGFRSACSLIATIREQFNINPVQIARFWVLWTHAFSASVMLASVVTHGATTKMAQAALGELRSAAALFEQAAGYGGRATKFLPRIRSMHDKAYRAFREGYQRPDIFTPRDSRRDEDDDLSIFSGRTRTVTTKAAVRPSPPLLRHSASRQQLSANTNSPTTTEASSSSAGELRASQSPTAASPQVSEDMPSLVAYGGAVHPMLVDDMRSFEGQLDEQIQAQQQQQYYAAHGPAGSPEAAPHPVLYAHAPAEDYAQYAEPQEGQDPRWRWGHQEMPPPPAPVHARTQQQQQPLYAPPPHPPPPPVFYQSPHATHAHEDAYAVHGYDAPHHAPPAQGSYAQTAYAVPPAQQQQHAHAFWQPVTPAHEYPPPPDAAARLHIHPHAQGMHAAAYAAPPPPPASGMLPVHTGSYSLTETWTSFVQHELPVPPMAPRVQPR
ncbi:hypothetical protein PHLGIDRAFT_127425 [Phlebiopsis gigantea 11061_1 CR5-6]|uniref:Zn(2)-C6 fungal-type domain-containing protein n=1 Tax=Phlebiopsis gigantea (strain 11061_1 CR5-6) TaxID=745531 RepID=A0A0C3RZE7_PHLG1|nr:hypothetical protein PHLGIDRAFT_127425 [Phlebiopsis gigantea 11061_1 CR5-6]